MGVSYDLEYGSARIEIHEDSFVGDERVLVIDDVLATGALPLPRATCSRARAKVVGFEAVVELAFLHGRSWTGATRTRRSSSAGTESAGRPGQGIT